MILTDMIWFGKLSFVRGKVFLARHDTLRCTNLAMMDIVFIAHHGISRYKDIMYALRNSFVPLLNVEDKHLICSVWTCYS